MKTFDRNSGAWHHDRLRAGGTGINSSQPDELQFKNLRQEISSNSIPFEDVIELLDNFNIPPQLRQTPYVSTILNATDIQLLLPANPNRMSFIVGYVDRLLSATSFIFLSYGAPPFPQFGIPMPSGFPFAEGNGTISIDPIYVGGSGTLGAPGTNYPVTVLAYEGVLAVESHLHRNTRRAR